MNTNLAITWSPNLKKFGNPISVQMQYSRTFDKILKLLSCCDMVCIYPELNNNGDIHYHGTIHVCKTVTWYKSVLPTLKHNGFVVIKKNPNEGWMNYQSKDKELMESIIGLNFPIREKDLETVMQVRRSMLAEFNDLINGQIEFKDASPAAQKHYKKYNKSIKAILGK